MFVYNTNNQHCIKAGKKKNVFQYAFDSTCSIIELFSCPCHYKHFKTTIVVSRAVTMGFYKKEYIDSLRGWIFIIYTYCNEIKRFWPSLYKNYK